MKILVAILPLHLFVVLGRSFAAPRPLLSFNELRDGARGQDVGRTIEELEKVWTDIPAYVEAKFKNSAYPDEAHRNDAPTLEEIQEDTIQYMRVFLARFILRYQIETGTLSSTDPYTAWVEQDVEGRHRRVTVDQIFNGDLLFARQDYEGAIKAYQKAMKLGSNESFGFGRKEIDDVLFTKIGFAYYKLGRRSDAIRNWKYAAELQETQGLFLEALVSKLRQGQIASKILQPTLLKKYHPTVVRTLQKAKEGLLKLPDDLKDAPISNGNLDDDEDALLDSAFASFVRGDYQTSLKEFAKVTNANQEKWALFSLLLRQRFLDDVADCYDQLKSDKNPFLQLKRGVLQRTVLMDDWYSRIIKEELRANYIKGSMDALDAIKYASSHLLQSSIQEYNTTPDDLISTACEQFHNSSMLAVAYYQIGEYLMKVSTGDVESMEQEVQQEERMRRGLEFLEKALVEPDITPSVWIMATMAHQLTKLSIAVRTSHFGHSGATLAARIPGDTSPRLEVVVESNMRKNNGEPYVPRKQVRDEVLRRQREVTLMECQEKMVDWGMNESTTALKLARQLGDGPTERLLLTRIFGKNSTPVLNTREAEYYEDMKSGTGERAEEITRELLKDTDKESMKQNFLQNLIRALEKQGKYDEAISVFHELEDTGYFKRKLDDYNLVQIADLYKKNGNLEMAWTKFQELVEKKDSHWREYGYVGLGEISILRDDLEQGLSYFRECICISQVALDDVFGDEQSDSRQKSNAIAKISNAWSNAGLILEKHGFYDEALEFYQGSLESSDNEWFSFRENSMKCASAKIAALQLTMSQKNEADKDT